ncbi:MAG: DUF378 domain-containing protein [Clostridia bacterium]|nr:DUF378 domain-containing protein [Clostridia bacterium]
MIFFAFLSTLFGCINWLSIGMLQYDIVAGFFGTQAHIFSRIIYIIIGFSALYLMVAAIKQRGRVNLIRERVEVRNEVQPEEPEKIYNERENR